ACDLIPPLSLWGRLPPSRQKGLVVSLGRLVQQNLPTRQRNSHEPDPKCPRPGPGRAENSEPPSPEIGGGLRPAIHGPTGPASPGVDPAPVRPGQPGRAPGLAP